MSAWPSYQKQTLTKLLFSRSRNAIEDTSNLHYIGTQFHLIMLWNHTQIKPAQGQAWPHEYDGLTAALPLSPQNHGMSAVACPNDQMRLGQFFHLCLPVFSPFTSLNQTWGNFPFMNEATHSLFNGFDQTEGLVLMPRLAIGKPPDVK
tara:strand:+ start:92 stop:535 length:444 start_codon:yes stop_codon:yes gene_type:complete